MNLMASKPPIVDLDFETRSCIDLFVVGAYNYARHPSTQVQLMAYTINGKKYKSWREDRSSWEIPKPLAKAIKDGGIIRAWNATFEILIWKYVCAPKMGWPKMPPERFIDAMAVASRFGYPLSLAKCGAAIGLPTESAKIADGKRLIKMFCMPDKNGDWVTPTDKPEEFKRYIDYNDQDVVAQREILKQLPTQKLQDQEQIHWLNDFYINQRGIMVDLHVAQAAVRTEARIKVKLLAELSKMTKGEVTTGGQIAKIKAWVSKVTKGKIELDNLQEKTIIDLLRKKVPAKVERILRIRQACGRASTGKYKKMLSTVTYADHRIRGLFQFNGAMRTSRWSGRGVQMHSLPRGKVKIDDRDMIHIMNGEIDYLETEIGPYQDVLSSAVRQTFIAAHGKKFLVVDWSGIENRALAWITGSARLIQQFIDKIDQYKLMASKMYHKPQEEINDAERFLGKQIVLGAGYCMGGKTFSARMEDFNIDLPVPKADVYIKAYRDANPEIVKLWYGIGDAAVKAVRTGKGKYKKIIFQYHNGFLYCRLPNNKLLTYPEVKLRKNSWGNAEITYKENFYGKWARTSTYGGKLVENICQAISRELLAEAMVQLEKAGYPVVGHIHDEIICEVPIDGKQTLKEMSKIMCTNSKWNKDFPLATEGFETQRYRKG